MCGATNQSVPGEQEASVTIVFKLSDDAHGTLAERDAIARLEAALLDELAARGIGAFDGDEFGGGWCRLFLYGLDADALAATVLDVLRRIPGARPQHMVKRFAPPDGREIRVDVGGALGLFGECYVNSILNNSGTDE